MIDLGCKPVLGVNVNAVDYDTAVARIIAAASARRPFTVSALAVHGVMTGVRDPEHRYRLNHFDLIVPDGQPVRWALRLLHGAILPDRVYGPELTLRVCAQAARDGLPIYLYGSRDVVLQALQKSLVERFPALVIAGAEPSKFRVTTPEEQREVAERIRASGARITLVGLGCPRQEVWAFEYRDLLGMPILAVGAAFDFHAGLLAQAPESMRNHGLEWLFRLIKEPRRLWRRYILLNPAFVALLFAQWLHLPFGAAPERRPAQQLRYG